MPDNHWVNQAAQHARHLADKIGARGANSPEEKQAADYVLKHWQSAGVTDAHAEAFRTGRSGWLPVAIVFSMAVWSALICWAGFYLTSRVAPGALIGAGLSLLALWLLYRHFTFRSYPLRRWLAREASQNVVGHSVPSDSITQRVVVVANLDTPPDAWVFRTPRRLRFFRSLLVLAAISLVVSVVMFVLGALEAWGWAFMVAAICGFVQGGGVLLAIQADQGEYAADVNTAGSALGVLLALGEQLAQTPLRQTEVWLLAAGSQTSDNNGLRAFIDRHRAELGKAWFVGLDRVGAGERVISVSGGRLRPEVQQLLAELAIPRGPRSPIGLPTPIEAARVYGYRSLCLTLQSNRPVRSTGPILLNGLQAAQQAVTHVLHYLDK